MDCNATFDMYYISLPLTFCFFCFKQLLVSLCLLYSFKHILRCLTNFNCFMDVLLNSLVVYYAATWATFKPILKKQKNLPIPNLPLLIPIKLVVFWEMEQSCPKKLNKTPLGNYETNDKIMYKCFKDEYGRSSKT